MSNEQYLMRRLIDGISGWLTYQQAAGAKTLYCEHFLYPPIHHVAKGREWNVRAQEPVRKEKPNVGAPKTIDFIFFRNESDDYDSGLVFLEVKYLRDSNRTVERQELADDVKKLRAISSSDIESATTISKCGKARKFLVVVAQGSVFETFAKATSRACLQLGGLCMRTDQNQTRNTVLLCGAAGMLGFPNQLSSD